MNNNAPSTPEMSRDAALAQWTVLLGSEHVLNDAVTLERYARSTASCSTRPLAVLRPASAADVVEVVNIAAAYGIPLYPISRGRNWGYGDACAATDGQVIVELSRMCQIEVDHKLAYAVIEPGVTQRQLSEYLRHAGYPLIMDCTGAGPDTSLVGNILERGFGHSPYGNRFQTVAGIEVVLANGKVLKTGFGHYSTARTTHLYPYGIGPYLDGLFTQSNMGIITRLGLWLMPAPERIEHFLCFVEKHEDINEIVDTVRPLRMDGTLRSVVHIGNDLRLISGGRTFPTELTDGQSRLPEAVRARLRTEAGVGAWTVSGALYGSRRQVAAARAAVRKALKGRGRKLVFLDERTLAFGGFAAKLLSGSRWGRILQQKIAAGLSLFEMNRGIPNGRFLAGAYWRRKGGLPMGFPEGADPAADDCGMLWIAPVLPLRGADALRLHELLDKPIFERHGFDLFITLSMINERALGGVITVAYDKHDPAEVERAQACYRDAFEAVMAAGYIPYRVGVQSMAQLDEGSSVFWETVSAVKAALDPNGLIAPGRYEPRCAKTWFDR